jgi:hypothetical protein
MTRLRFAPVCVAILMAGLACGGRSSPGATPLVDRNTLTAVELNQRSFYSAYEAVEALRPLWLNSRPRGGAVQVYIDENRLGGLEALRTVRIASVDLIRYMDGIQATARYGRGHDGGAILVTTRAAGR